jgi:NAD(P)-dependent dehydrogenase (short-subunit alcohol dehydrogenase family)
MALGSYRSAVVTGGASGIGRACALAFAREGCAIAVADVNDVRLAETQAAVEALGQRCLAIRCDVTSDTDVDQLAREVTAAFGPPDIVMLNAGISVLGPPDRVPLDLWRRNMEVNYFGVLRGMLAFIPAMRERGSGHLVITASIAGRYAYSYDAGPYIGSKHAAYGLAENLALYLIPQGIDVSVLCPGLVVTNMGETAQFVGVDRAAGWSHMPQYMLDQPKSPEDIANVVIDGIRTRKFLLYTHAGDAELIARRAQDVDAAIAAQIAAMPDPTPPR